MNFSILILFMGKNSYKIIFNSSSTKLKFNLFIFLFYYSNKHIKGVSSCVTEGLDRNTSYFKRQAGKHALSTKNRDISLYRRYVNKSFI